MRPTTDETPDLTAGVALVLSTGGKSVRPDLPGFDRGDVLVLRTKDDAAAERQLLATFREDGRVVAAAGVGRDHDLLVVEDEALCQPAR